MELKLIRFNEINLSDPFFDSLKESYREFSDWFLRKSNECAYVFEDNGLIQGFLYLKIEKEAVTDVMPPLPPLKRLKVGTMKILPHGTKLGERFIKKIIDNAVKEKTEEIYVTVFSQHEALISLFFKYGFENIGNKITANGTELVLTKRIHASYISIYNSYPLVKLGNKKVYVLSLQPKYHTKLLPDSILKNEKNDIVEDISPTNSIHKVYLTKMTGVDGLCHGDIVVIYRTSDGLGPAHYRSVATSIGVVEDYRHLDSFLSRDDFFKYCGPYSIFTENELNSFWNRRNYPFVFKFMYNVTFKKKVTRGTMIEKLGISNDYWGFFEITHDQLRALAKEGMVDESLIID